MLCHNEPDKPHSIRAAGFGKRHEDSHRRGYAAKIAAGSRRMGTRHGVLSNSHADARKNQDGSWQQDWLPVQSYGLSG